MPWEPGRAIKGIETMLHAIFAADANDAASWMSLIRTDGLATALVVFTMIGMVLLVRWLGTNVARPMTAKGIEIADAHIAFLNENTKATQAITSGVGHVIQVQSVHGEKIDDIHDLLVIRRQGATQSQVSPSTITKETDNGEPTV